MSVNRVVSFKIDESLLHILDSFAAKKRLSRSDVIRQAIIKFLKENGVETPTLEKRVGASSEELAKDEPIIVIKV